MPRDFDAMRKQIAACEKQLASCHFAAFVVPGAREFANDQLDKARADYTIALLETALGVDEEPYSPAVEGLLRAARELGEARASGNALSLEICLDAVKIALAAVDLEAKGGG